MEFPHEIYKILNKFSNSFENIEANFFQHTFSINYTTQEQKKLSQLLREISKIDKENKKYVIKILKLDKENKLISFKIKENENAT